MNLTRYSRKSQLLRHWHWALAPGIYQAKNHMSK